MTYCSYCEAEAILADDLAPFWDKAEAEACIVWVDYWGERKSYLKSIGEW